MEIVKERTPEPDGPTRAATRTGLPVCGSVHHERMSDADLRMAYEKWDRAEYERLVAYLNKHSVEETARRLQRSKGAVTAAIKNLYHDEDLTADACVSRLRSDPDWRSRLDRARSTAIWTDDRLKRLAEAWRDGCPTMPDLSEELGISELLIANTLLREGHADDAAEVVDRLGCTPGRALEKRSRLARCRRGETVWALVITDVFGDVAHLGVHESAAEARQELDDLMGDADVSTVEPADGSTTAPERRRLQWAIVRRIIGERRRSRYASGEFFGRLRPLRPEQPGHMADGPR